MSMTSTTISNNGGGNGVFGNLLSEIGGAIGSTAKEVIPIWTRQQLQLQSTDQLNRDTYTGDHSANLTQPLSSTESTAPQDDNFFKKYQMPIMITGGVIAITLIVLAIK